MNPNLMFTWPNARVAMDDSGEETKLRGGVPNAMYGTSRLWDDGVRACVRAAGSMMMMDLATRQQ